MGFVCCVRLRLKQAFKYVVVASLLWISASSVWTHFRRDKPTITPKGVVSRISVADVQNVLDYVSENLKIEYQLLMNEEKSFLAHLRLKNEGGRTIEPCCFTIFFYHFNPLDAVNLHKKKTPYAIRYFRNDTARNPLSSSSDFEVRHVNGNSYRLDMTKEFKGLLPGEEMTIVLTGFRWIVSRSTIIPNWYVASSIPSSWPRLIRSTAGDDLGFVAPFDSLEKTSRSASDSLRPLLPPQRFEKYRVKDIRDSMDDVVPTPSIVNRPPVPKEMKIESEIFKIYYSSGLKNEATYLKDHLIIEYTEESSEVDCLEKSFLLKLDEGLRIDKSDKGKISSQGYKLTVDANRDCVSIVGATSAGVFYGIVSAISLMKSTSATEFSLPALELVDSPRFAHRGLMVDVARHFQTKEKIKHLIDALATYKMNKLHLHLSDDEAWRLEIPGLEELTQFGSIRGHDLGEEHHLMSMLGDGPFTNSSGSGFYTVSDYREILRHALSHHVEIIPEFDMPGHSHAAIRSMEHRRVQLEASGHKAQAGDYLLHDPDDRSSYLSAQFFTDGVINPCLESSYRFVNHVVGEVSRMQKDIVPLQRFHFGGDEVPDGAYVKSPICTEFLQSHKDLSGPKDLKAYFIRKISEILVHHGLEVQGWEDGFSSASGNMMPLSSFKSKVVVSQSWYNIWERAYAKRAYQYANEGYKVILTPATAVYFDHPQEPDPEDWGLHWATRYIDIKRTFFFAPDSYYDNIDFDFWGNRISRQQMCGATIECPPLKSPENIIGLEAAIWSETVRSADRLDSMVWPRLLAVAERGWHKADWESMQASCKDGEQDCPELRARRKAKMLSWTKFANIVGRKELRRLETLGIRYYLPRPGARVLDGKLEVNTLFPGLIVQTSVDDGKTWNDYDSNNHYSGTVLVAKRSFDGNRRSDAVKVEVK